MNTRYKILFAVDILNDFYKDSRSTDFNFVPSAGTALLLKKYHLITKVIANRLIVLIKVDNAGIPIALVDTESKFAFYLNLKNPVFVNFSNIALDILRTNRFYFTNLNQNKANSFLNVTGKINNYDNTKTYLPCDFADNGTGTIFESIKKTTGNNTTTDSWVSRGSNQPASLVDMIEPSTRIFNYTAPSVGNQFKIVIFSLDKVANTYTKTLKTEIQNFDEPVNNIQVDMSSIESGKYRITINTDEMFLYVDDSFVYNNYFGVIEIFSHLPNTNEFAFFERIAQYNAATSYTPGDLADNGTGNIFECIKETTGNDTSKTDFWTARENIPGNLSELCYSLRFANRMTIWKYRAKTNDVTAINDSSSTYTFSPLPPLEFISDRPIPVSETPVKTLSFSSVKFTEVKAIANPTAERLSTIIINGDNLFCTEVNLNY